MSKIDEIADKKRPEMVGVNKANKSNEYDAAHQDALSTGDEPGKGETTTVGGKTDITKRGEARAINTFGPGNEYPPTEG